MRFTNPGLGVSGWSGLRAGNLLEMVYPGVASLNLAWRR
jgi:hypothetical protein